MTLAWQRRLTLVAVAGFAHWFFGNLYEAVVFSPNWIDDSPAQLQRLNELFVHTSPTVYFVPVIAVATLLTWALFVRNREPAVAGDYRRASWLVALAMLTNAFIVATIITRLFGRDYLAHRDQLHDACWRWNVLNLVRMAFVAAASASLFKAFRKLDRAPGREQGG